jgi:hypothetical protein
LLTKFRGQANVLGDQGDLANDGEFKIKPQPIDTILNDSPNNNKRLLKQPTNPGGQVFLTLNGDDE